MPQKAVPGESMTSIGVHRLKGFVQWTQLGHNGLESWCPFHMQGHLWGLKPRAEGQSRYNTKLCVHVCGFMYLCAHVSGYPYTCAIVVYLLSFFP